MASASVQEYDLSGVISGFLDNHLVFPLLEFLAQKKIYDVKEIEANKLDLVEKTNMVDYAVDIYQQLNQTDEVRSCQDGGGSYCDDCQNLHHLLPMH